MVFGHSAGLVSVSLKLSHIGLRLSRAFFFSTFLFRFFRTSLPYGFTARVYVRGFSLHVRLPLGSCCWLFSLVFSNNVLFHGPGCGAQCALERGTRVCARDEGAFHFSMYGFTLSALTRYTFLAHKTRILSLPFEVMILYVAVPEMRSLKSHAPPHTRAATPHPFRPLRCTTQGRCFIHTSRSCTVKYGFGSQAC